MFYSLTGILSHTDSKFVVINCHGVGYRCFTSSATLNRLGKIGSEITLYTFVKVSEDSINIFGFIDYNELNCFKILLSVSGVGTKVALAMLSTISPEQVAVAVASNDHTMLTATPGVGPKLAKRIILELKDKLKKMDTLGVKSNIEAVEKTSHNSNTAGAMNALEVLGYSKNETAPVLAKFDNTLSVEQLIKMCLRELSKGV